MVLLFLMLHLMVTMLMLMVCLSCRRVFTSSIIVSAYGHLPVFLDGAWLVWSNRSDSHWQPRLRTARDRHCASLRMVLLLTIDVDIDHCMAKSKVLVAVRPDRQIQREASLPMQHIL